VDYFALNGRGIKGSLQCSFSLVNSILSGGLVFYV